MGVRIAEAVKWMLMPWKRYARFGGRARRREFWLWTLYLFVSFALLGLLDAALGLDPVPDSSVPPSEWPGYALGSGMTGLFFVAVLLPQIAVQVRRLHDINAAGWWLLILASVYALAMMFITLGNEDVGLGLMSFGLLATVALLAISCVVGTKGDNRFGADPRDAGALADVFS